MGVKADGGPAFPVAGRTVPGRWIDGMITADEHIPARDGMTLRDHFAGLAMQGDWAAQKEDLTYSHATDETFEKSARVYYRMADAMLAARKGDGQ